MIKLIFKAGDIIVHKSYTQYFRFEDIPKFEVLSVFKDSLSIIEIKTNEHVFTQYENGINYVSIKEAELYFKLDILLQ